MESAFRERYGPWALVAGASEGIGAEFCHKLAARGLSIALVARRPEPLDRLASELERAHGVRTRRFAFESRLREHLEELGARDRDLELGSWSSAPLRRPSASSSSGSLGEHGALLDLNCRARWC